MSGQDLTWEEIVNRVTIASDYGKVSESARLWQAALRQVTEQRDVLRELSRQSESWRGGGGNAFRDHVAKLITALDQTVQSHERVVNGLAACAGHLERAVKSIPIPSWMYDDVVSRRAAYGNGALEGVRPGEFWGGLVKWIRDQVPDDSQAESVLRSGEEHMRLWLMDARAAYDRLCRDYAAELAGMPRGTPENVPGVNSSVAGVGSSSTHQNGQTSQQQRAGQQPGTQPGSTTAPGQQPGSLPGTNPGLTQNPGLPGTTTLPGTGTPTFPGVGSFDPGPSSGLDGVSSLTGAGFGGVGGGAGGLGPAVSLPPSAMSGGGAMAGSVLTPPGGPVAAGGVRVSGQGGQGRGMAGGAMGVMPMGAGQGMGATDRAGTETWLKEDEDYFGSDASTPDGVLDA